MVKYEFINDIQKNNTKIKIHKKSDAMGDSLVSTKFKIPREAVKFLSVPYVPNGFENSCSESSAEMLLRYWDIQNWSQYEIHQYGYQTFEGSISVGDIGLMPFFQHEKFINSKNQQIHFNLINKEKVSLDELKKTIDADIPIIIRYYTNNNGDKHTVVLIGYNADGFYKHDNDLGASLFMKNDSLIDSITQYIVIYPKNKQFKL